MNFAVYLGMKRFLLLAILLPFAALSQTVELSYSQQTKTAVEAAVFANNSPIGVSAGYAEGGNWLFSAKVFLQHGQFVANLQPGIYTGANGTGALFRSGVGIKQGKFYLMGNFVAMNQQTLKTGFGLTFGYKFD
jgi:hypothetical protein